MQSTANFSKIPQKARTTYLRTAITIDDDRDVAETLADYLTMLNIRILGIGYDGKDAVELYKKHTPDLVFSDFRMPQYDGIYALENIRKIDPLAKIVMITGESKDLVNEKLKPLNPTSIFYKPFDHTKFQTFLEKI